MIKKKLDKKKVICIICARGGSKSLKNKNILKIGGIPLIAYPIMQAKKSKNIGTVLVTTDSKKIAAIAKKY
jgi:CMP-N-acetylneuraminic acid synthetase